MDEYKHKSKNGKETLLKDLALPHLKNIINRIERMSKEGYIDLNQYEDDFEETKEIRGKTIVGEEVLKVLNYQFYTDELERREKEEAKNEKD